MKPLNYDSWADLDYKAYESEGIAYFLNDYDTGPYGDATLDNAAERYRDASKAFEARLTELIEEEQGIK